MGKFAFFSAVQSLVASIIRSANSRPYFLTKSICCLNANLASSSFIGVMWLISLLSTFMISCIALSSNLSYFLKWI